ncbi:MULTISPECIES: OmpA family protein [Flavobacteriaceae]|uniref:OmpA family protein n=1 Tax=Flavobacteriaceae TaxID=49546 RepID=UPI0014925922|nr:MULTISPECIES: OmpA family protein [Allomuricauda]MDC6364539.1 OmpA family protein [Muricauda sp. AC10]
MKRSLILSIFTFLIYLLPHHEVYTQKSKLKRANEEFDQYEFIDARKIYLKVAESGYESSQLYKKLGDTYYFNSEYEDAIQWYQKLIAKYPDQLEADYYYRAAQTYKSIGNYHESKKMMGEYTSRTAGSKIAKNFIEGYPYLDSLVDFESTKFEVKNITNTQSGSDFGPSLYKDKIVYASSSGNPKGDKKHYWNNLPYLDLYEAEIDDNGNLSKPTSLKGDVNSPYHESSAVFTKNGKTMYFTRNNYINGKKKSNKDRVVTLKIYRAKLSEDGPWENIQELPFNDDSHSVAHPALSPDETRLYFSSNMPGTYGESDIWYVTIDSITNTYSAPVNLGPQINTEARETFPYVSKTNNLYFSSDGHLGLGGLDIFAISLNNEGNFKKVTNLKKPINTNKDDFGFIIDEEKQVGYLSSNRDGNEGSRSDDIYSIKEKCGTIQVKGMVTDAATGEPIEASVVTLIDENNNEISKISSDANGLFMFKDSLDCGKQYAIRAENDTKKYVPTEENITTPGGTETLEVSIKLTQADCPVDDLGCRLNLQPIYFDYGKYTIRKDAEVELAKILQAMKEYPQLKIHIESHTDSRSSYQFNMRLSTKRAWSTKEWLIKRGIDRSRLSSKGYGETQLLNHCSSGVKCSQEEHQLNRRSVFLIKE